MRLVPFRLRSHPSKESPARNTSSLSAYSTYQFPSIIIHGGEIHVTLSRLSLINVSSQFATAFYNAFAKRNSERSCITRQLVFLTKCRCLRELHLCWGIRVRHRFRRRSDQPLGLLEPWCALKPTSINCNDALTLSSETMEGHSAEICPGRRRLGIKILYPTQTSRL